MQILMSSREKNAPATTILATVVGRVFDIQRFSVHDGPGIRTTVFLKGCPLRCLWCHNPESIDPRPQLSYRPDRCIGCMRCVGVCPHGCHRIVDGAHVLDRTDCTTCGLCAEECYAEALEIVGKDLTVGKVMETVLSDRPFYETSDGGMTISGGEPLFQADFTHALLTVAKQEGLHTCLDTSGHAAWEAFERVLPVTDMFLFDIKETDPTALQELTGASERLVIRNLESLSQQGATIVLRCPLIPGLNDRTEHLQAIGEIAERLDGIEFVDVHPYHPLGRSKLDALAMEDTLPKVETPAAEIVAEWVRIVQTRTSVPVRSG
jgi:pyruvate formate lyase activating enzyme